MTMLCFASSFGASARRAFARRRALVWRYRWLILGFGASASLSLLLPLLNFVCMPALVVGGTLMLLHLEARSDAAQQSSPPAAL